jgi:hypothetical protein
VNASLTCDLKKRLLCPRVPFAKDHSIDWLVKGRPSASCKGQFNPSFLCAVPEFGNAMYLVHIEYEHQRPIPAMYRRPFDGVTIRSSAVHPFEVWSMISSGAAPNFPCDRFVLPFVRTQNGSLSSAVEIHGCPVFHSLARRGALSLTVSVPFSARTLCGSR